MKLRSNLTMGSASHERGFALIAILALAALMSAYLIATALSSAGFVNEREDRNMNALRQAKAALIAYAANEQWQLYRSLPAMPPVAYFQPGALPCPDGDNDGDSDGICSSALLRIGRLPYKTIGSPDLADANGERLWYAVSSNFRKLQNGTPPTIISSDTRGLLTVTGTGPATNVVAIVFAPGPPTRDPVTGLVQDRSAPNINRLASYLEGFTAGANDYTFATNALPNDTFNDRLIVITQAELMAAVEPVVVGRIERDIKSYITQNYKPDDLSNPASWWTGGYPFAVPWGGGPGQPQDNYKGDAATPTRRGLMPVTQEANFVRWDTASISVTQLPGGMGGYGSGSLTIGPPNCSASTGGQISCTFNYPGDSDDRAHIRVQATLLNAGRAFVNAMAAGSETLRDAGGSVRSWSNTTSPNPWTVSSTLLANGHGTIRYEGRLINAQSMGNGARIEVPISYHPVSDSTDTQAGWFIANQWYRQTYYAVSQGYAPGGGASCTAGGTCLTVNNISGTQNDKRLILVFAGWARDGSIRPTSSLGNYLEGQNSTPNDLIFENRAGATPSINDRVVVVAP